MISFITPGQPKSTQLDGSIPKSHTNRKAQDAILAFSNMDVEIMDINPFQSLANQVQASTPAVIKPFKVYSLTLVS